MFVPDEEGLGSRECAMTVPDSLRLFQILRFAMIPFEVWRSRGLHRQESYRYSVTERTTFARNPTEIRESPSEHFARIFQGSTLQGFKRIFARLGIPQEHSATFLTEILRSRRALYQDSSLMIVSDTKVSSPWDREFCFQILCNGFILESLRWLVQILCDDSRF